MSKSKILEYQQRCYTTYAKRIGLPDKYVYLYGNPIRPLVPVQTAQDSIMIIGAYPSARFEQSVGGLIPVADNLSPFHPELYFDGLRTRLQESAHGLKTYVLDPLGLSSSQAWITDLVKVFLFKQGHINNYRRLGYCPSHGETRSHFSDYAIRSIEYIAEEYILARPKLVVTLGEEVARVMSQRHNASTEELLNGTPYELRLGQTTLLIAHLAHPDACRRFPKWRMATEVHIRKLRQHLEYRGDME